MGCRGACVISTVTRSESTHRAARRSKPSVYRHSFSERVGVVLGTLFLMTHMQAAQADWSYRAAKFGRVHHLCGQGLQVSVSRRNILM